VIRKVTWGYKTGEREESTLHRGGGGDGKKSKNYRRLFDESLRAHERMRK